MKLSFSKNEELEISVTQKIGGERKPFNYIGMIKSLIENKRLDVPEIIGDFSDSEKESILSMIKHINKEVASFYSDEDEDEDEGEGEGDLV